MMLRISLVALSLLACLPAPGFAFDCAKAKTPAEKAICADPALKRLDDALSVAYAALKAKLAPPEQKMLTAAQKRWIARREFCEGAEEGIVACVTARTAERISLLSARPESGPGASGAMMPVFLVQEGSPTLYDIDIAVLRFTEPKTPGEQTLNRLADEVLASAKLGPHGEKAGGAILAQEDRFTLTYASPALMSVRHDVYANEGGAHGNYGTGNYNIDMATGRLLTVKDVLPEPSAAILTLWCKKQIEAEKTKRVPEIDVSEDQAERDRTIAEQVRNLESWSIGQDEITVSFDPYAVGAYAEGAYECRFPTSGVKELALKGALLP